MNLFRSKEHARNWSQYKEGTEAGLLSLDQAMRIMSTPRHQNRLQPDYVSRMQETMPPFVQQLLDVSRNSPFWDLRPD